MNLSSYLAENQFTILQMFLLFVILLKVWHYKIFACCISLFKIIQIQEYVYKKPNN